MHRQLVMELNETINRLNYEEKSKEEELGNLRKSTDELSYDLATAQKRLSTMIESLGVKDTEMKQLYEDKRRMQEEVDAGKANVHVKSMSTKIAGEYV